jgi:hypothetical protein
MLNGCLCPHCFKEWLPHPDIFEESQQLESEFQNCWYDYCIGQLCKYYIRLLCGPYKCKEFITKEDLGKVTE